MNSANGQDGRIRTIEFGSERIRFAVRRSQRQRFRVAVHPDMSVIVDAPADRPIEDVISRVRDKAQWILRQQEFFSKYIPKQPAKRFVSGETLQYLGRQYRLKVVSDASQRVRLQGRYLWVHSLDKSDRDRTKRLVERWYRSRATHVFETRLDRWEEALRRYGVARPAIRIRRMKRRWGSCSPSGAVLLNTNLVKAPVHCIDYVIVHELCHLKHPNHSPAFFTMMSRLIPDWKRRKERLERVEL